MLFVRIPLAVPLLHTTHRIAKTLFALGGVLALPIEETVLGSWTDFSGVEGCHEFSLNNIPSI